MEHSKNRKKKKKKPDSKRLKYGLINLCFYTVNMCADINWQFRCKCP